MCHDQNFKNLLLDHPHQAVAFFAATEAVAIGVARITPVRQEQFQERLGERSSASWTYRCWWSGPTDDVRPWRSCSKKESDARRFSIHRLAHYCLDLAELLKTDRVVPVVIFLRRAAGVAQRLRLSGDQGTYP